MFVTPRPLIDVHAMRATHASALTGENNIVPRIGTHVKKCHKGTAKETDENTLYTKKRRSNDFCTSDIPGLI